MASIIWLALIVVLLIVEMVTVGLTTIWFAAGAIVALLLCALGAAPILQVLAFLICSIALLIFTRPLALKHLNAKREKTNYEGLAGKIVRITEAVNNINETGKAFLSGTEWTVRTQEKGVTLESGTLAKVLGVSGVKLIVEEYKEEV